MEVDRFWSIVGEVEPTVADDPDGFDEELADALAELTPKEVVAFGNQWTAFANRAFTWDLWAAAWLLRGDAFDWEFSSFRDRLIALGRTVYERAVAEPDSLADVPLDWRDGDEDEDGEGDVWLSLAAGDAYERLTGGAITDAEPAEEPEPPEPVGEPWADEAEAAARLPRIAARTGPFVIARRDPCPACGHLTGGDAETCDVCAGLRPVRPWEAP